MNIGSTITRLRKEKRLSREDLGTNAGTSGAVIGRYERNEITPSVEITNKIAKALDVSLDYLVGETSQTSFDKRTLKRIQELELLEESKKQTLYDLIDTYIRDCKTRKAFSNAV